METSETITKNQNKKESVSSSRSECSQRLKRLNKMLSRFDSIGKYEIEIFLIPDEHQRKNPKSERITAYGNIIKEYEPYRNYRYRSRIYNIWLINKNDSTVRDIGFATSLLEVLRTLESLENFYIKVCELTI